MPIVDRDWWTVDKRPILKVGGNVTADVEQDDIASCAIAAAGIADGAVTSGKLGASAVTCAALSDGHVITAKLANTSVTSEKAGNPLRTRSVIGITSDPAKGAVLAVTCYFLWRPSVRAEIQKIQVTPLTPWAAVTSCANLQVWTCTGGIGSFSVCTTTYGPAGVSIDLGALSNTCVAADQDVRVGLSNLNACDDSPAHMIQIDYITSG